MAKHNFLTPVGRLVQGHPMEAQTKDQSGRPLLTQSGQPTQRYFIAVAFRKGDPAFESLRALITQAAREGFPHLFDAAGNCTHPRFSFKIADGDGVDDNGKPNANKEGFAGHWVLKLSSSFAPKCYHAGHYQPHEVIQDANQIQRGYNVRVSGTVEPNGQPNKPGVYVNLGMVEMHSVGPVIVGGPDAAAVFGGAATPAAPVAQYALPATPAVSTAVAPPAVPVVPQPAILTPPTVPQAPVRTMLAAANGLPYEAYIAQGWTDELLRQHGMMA